jgi:hypothetical protein
MRRASVAVMVVMAMTARDAGASVDGAIDDAKRALAELRYDDALKVVEEALHRGEAGPKQVRELFALAGQAAGSMNDQAGARLWFRRWLSVEPSGQLPPDTSPRITGLLDEARTSLRGSELRARALRRGPGAGAGAGAGADAGGNVDVVIQSDPVGLAEGVRAGERRVSLRAGATVSAVVVSDADVVDVLDHDGNTIVQLRVEMAPRAESAVSVRARGARAWWARWPAWAIATGSLVVVGGAGLGVALDARGKIEDLNANSASHEFSEARAVERRFDGAQWAARFAIGGAAVAGVVGTVLFVRERGERGERGGVSVQVGGGGAAVSWGRAW